MLPARACTFSFITTWFSSPEFLQTEEAIMINIGCRNKRATHWYRYFISKYISERRDCRDGMRTPGSFEPPTNLGIGRQCSICQHVTHQDINITHIKTSRHETNLHIHWNVSYPPHLPWAYWILGCVNHIEWRVGGHCCVCGYTRAQQTLTQVIIWLDSFLSSPVTSLKHLSVAIVMDSILC